MLRSTRPDSSPYSHGNAVRLRVLAASVGLCTMLYGSSLHAQGAPQPQPGPSAPAPAPGPALQPPPPGAAPQQPSAMPPQPPPPGATTAQPAYPPPQGYGYPPPYGAYPPGAYPPGGYPPGAYPQQQGSYPPPPSYYGQPYFYEQPPPAPPPTMRKNSTLMGIGIAMVAVGSVGFLSGLAALASANNRIDVYCDGGSRCGSRDDTGLQAVGGVLMVVSGAVTIAGIPLWVIGGRKVPLKTEQPEGEKTAKVPLPAPVLHIGPGSASLAFSF